MNDFLKNINLLLSITRLWLMLIYIRTSNLTKSVMISVRRIYHGMKWNGYHCIGMELRNESLNESSKKKWKKIPSNKKVSRKFFLLNSHENNLYWQVISEEKSASAAFREWNERITLKRKNKKLYEIKNWYQVLTVEL